MIMLKDEAQKLIDRGYIWYEKKVTTSDIGEVCRLPFPNANSKDKPPKELNWLLHPFIRKMNDELSEHFNAKFMKAEIWDDVDEGSKEWHNDNKYKKSMANLSVLIYCDERKEGNSIQIRGPLGEMKILPDRYDMVIVNQNKKFEHKASISEFPRRVIGLQYFIEELEWI